MRVLIGMLLYRSLAVFLLLELLRVRSVTVAQPVPTAAPVSGRYSGSLLSTALPLPRLRGFAALSMQSRDMRRWEKPLLRGPFFKRRLDVHVRPFTNRRYGILCAKMRQGTASSASRTLASVYIHIHIHAHRIASSPLHLPSPPPGRTSTWPT